MNNPIDWKAFEYKFSGDPRAAFESLAYILFCYEFKQTYGIFRYYNQPYIETQPANIADGHKVGFQAKYYDAGTQMSSKEQDLKDAIKGAKNKYVGIDRIIFYINREFSASSAKDKDKPEHQIRIEKYGKNLGIEIQWRGQSHIEKMLAMEELKYVKNLYFNVETGIDHFHESLINHKNSILKHIHSTIKYDEKDIKIAQDYQKLMDFQESDSQVLIIHGAAGTGKSAAVKDFLLKKDKNTEDEITVVFSAADLDVKEEKLFLKEENYGLQDLFGLYKNEKYRLCVIDSAEKYATARYPEVFGDILQQFLDHGWKVIITIRTFYKDSLCNLFLKNYVQSEQEILKLEKDTLTEMSAQYQFALPADTKLQDLLCNLFYLNLYLNLNHRSEDENMNIVLFREAIWSQVIRDDFQQYNNLPVKRETFIQRMVCDMLAHERYTYSLKDTDEFETISALETSGIIVPYQESRSDWLVSHDVYEEIVTSHIFTKRFKEEAHSGKTFFADLGNSLRSRKSYRIWLESRLSDDDDDLLEFFTDILQDEEIGQEWHDETMTALMNSESEEAYSILDMLLSLPGNTLFIRMLFLLNTACRTGINSEILQNFKKQEKTEFNQYRYTRPNGTAWKTILRYISENLNRIPWSEENLSAVTEVLNTWTYAEHRGEATRSAGLAALYLRKKIYAETKYKYKLKEDDTYKKLDTIILNAAIEIKTELKTLFAEILRENEFDHRTEYYPLIKKAVSNASECGMIHAAMPETLIKILKGYWLESETISEWDRHPGPEQDFGLKPHLNYEYYPVSALQTPVYPLLVAAPRVGLEFVLYLLNHTSECYQNSSLAKEGEECEKIEIIFSETEKVKQICSERLWKMHRGTCPNPNVLECVLMALEKWLLEVAEEFPENIINGWCLFLLKNSNNVAITATVLSVVEAYPEKLFKISCILLRTKEIFHYDISRQIAESGANFLKGWNPKGEIFDKERIASNNLEFRRTLFEHAIVNYQIRKGNLSEEEFNNRTAVLYKNIDQTTEDMENWDLNYHYAYYRMDLRKYSEKTEITEKDGQKYIGLKVHMPEELEKFSKNSEKEREQFYQDRHIELEVWSFARYQKKTKDYRKYIKYEKNPGEAYAEMQGIMKSAEDTSELQAVTTAMRTCAVILRDFREKLSPEEIKYCQATIQRTVKDWIVSDNRYLLNDGIDAVLPELTKMISHEVISADWDNPMFLLLGIMMKHTENLKMLPSCVADILWEQDRYAALKILYTYVHLYPIYRRDYCPYVRKENLKEFLEENKEIIQKSFAEEITGINEINTDSLMFDDLLSFHMFLNKKDEDNFSFVIKAGHKVWGRTFGKDTEDPEERRDFSGGRAYIGWLADYSLDLSLEKQRELVQNMTPYISTEAAFGSWIWEMVVCEVHRPRYVAFWNMWELLQPYVFRKCDEKKIAEQNENAEKYRSTQEITTLIKNYLLANNIWGEDVTVWESLKHENAKFYKMAAIRIGYHPATLYSIAYVLNSVGKDTFSKEGLEWLSIIIKNNPHLEKAALPANTQYYLEEYMNSLIKKEKFTLRTDNRRRKQVITVLNFLVSKGSTPGFRMRDEII